jgi:hypothetical protein
VKTDFWQSKTRSKNVTTVFSGLKPTARWIRDGISKLFKINNLAIVLQNTHLCILRVNMLKFTT